MKKIILFGLFFLSFLLLPVSALAWKNGSYAYQRDDYSYDDDYGTHDWLAEHALNLLLEEDASNWQWLNADDKKVIFLLGTEAPDNSKVETTLDGEVIEGFGDTAKHHIYFKSDESVLEDDAALLAKKWGDLAGARIEEGKLEQGAFYLGAMTHYIADLSMYAHIAQNDVDETFSGINFDEYHSEVEGYVGTRTNDYENTDEFFKLGDVDIKDDEKPYDLAVSLALNTYLDGGGTHDALWMHDNFFTDWANNYDDRDSESSTRQAYYDRIEESLTNAVEAIASAMAYIGGTESGIPSYPIWTMGIIFGISVIGIIIITKKRMWQS